MKVFVRGSVYILVCILVCILVSALSVIARGRQEPRPQVPAGIVIVRTYDQAGGVLRKGVGFAVSDSGDVIAPGDLIDGASRVEIAAEGKTYNLTRLIAREHDTGLVLFYAAMASGAARRVIAGKSIPILGDQVQVVVLNESSDPSIISANAISRAEPVYPDGGRQYHITGSVIVEIMIDETGHVASARAIGGNFHKPSDVSEEKARKIIPEFQKASVDAARRWKFKPATISGTPVKVIGTVTFNFAM